MMSNKTLIYIAGPTGIGKTKLSIDLAKKFQTEIISWDSRQFYKEMRIGTAVPTKAQLKEVNDLNETERGKGGFGSTGTK